MERDMKLQYFVLAFVMCCIFTVGAFAATIKVPTDQPTIEDAIAAASSGDEILVESGAYDYTSSGGISVNVTNLTIRGEGASSTILQTAGSSNLFNISASGVTIQDMKIEKTDKANQNIIYIGANDVTIKDNLILG